MVFENGAHQPVLALDLAAGDLEPTPHGWQSRAGTPAVGRLTLRRRHGRLIVGFRGRLPAFDMADASGTSTAGGGVLSWGLALGAACSESLRLICTDDAQGRRRCRVSSPAAGSPACDGRP